MIPTLPAKLEYPITLDEFKSYFLREAGLEYQPYDSWEKTVFDAGDWCFHENIFYKSLIDKNITCPTDEPEIDPETEEPIIIWEAGSKIYEPETLYLAGEVVYNPELDMCYQALEDTDTEPDLGPYWGIPNFEELYPGLRIWEKPRAYKAGEKCVAVVRYKVGLWKSAIDDNYSDPSKGENVPDLPTDVPYWELVDEEEETLDDIVLDLDIERAMGEAIFKFNPYLFPDNKYKTIFLYLTMFFLVYDKQMANSGMNGNSASGPVTSRTVGKMSVTYMQSTLYKNNPSYEFLSSNEYGKKAYNLMAPYLRGGVRVFCGASTGD